MLACRELNGGLDLHFCMTAAETHSVISSYDLTAWSFAYTIAHGISNLQLRRRHKQINGNCSANLQCISNLKSE